MGISITLKEYLADLGVSYDIISHKRAVDSAAIAQAAHVSGEKVAKAVVLKTDTGFLLVIVPSTHKVDLAKISHDTDQRLGLATEHDLSEKFADCDLGAVPACGSAFGLSVLIDKSLDAVGDVYFEAGDHEHLVHLSTQDFQRLNTDALYGEYSHHV